MPTRRESDQTVELTVPRRLLAAIDTTASYFGLSRDETAQMLIDWGLETLSLETWADPRDDDDCNGEPAEVISLAARRREGR